MYYTTQAGGHGLVRHAHAIPGEIAEVPLQAFLPTVKVL